MAFFVVGFVVATLRAVLALRLVLVAVYLPNEARYEYLLELPEKENIALKIKEAMIEKNLIYGMLTLPSNMFYTVTLPATLWFFDKAKEDNRILFIDARNIFTQIDRAHREFSEEQIANISIISQLRKGNRKAFTALVDRYFVSGFAQLNEMDSRVEPIAQQVIEVLDGTPEVVAEAKAAVSGLVNGWKQLGKFRKAYDKYLEEHSDQSDVAVHNKAQRKLAESLAPFFDALHTELNPAAKTDFDILAGIDSEPVELVRNLLKGEFARLISPLRQTWICRLLEYCTEQFRITLQGEPTNA